MAYYTINLKANKPYHQRTTGRVIVIDKVDGGPGVDVTLVVNDADGKTIPERRAGFKYVAPYTGVIFESPVDCTIAVFLTINDVDLGWVDGVQVSVTGDVNITNDEGHRIPVDIGGGVIEVTAAGVESHPEPQTAFTYPAPIAVGLVAATAINDATLRRVLFRNISTTQSIALGGAGVTMASPICLAPGDVWAEDGGAAGMHWYAIADAAAASLQILGLK